MKVPFFLFGFIILCIFMVNAQKQIPLKIGTTVINIETIEIKTDALLFINLHNDEKTSIKAIKELLPKYSGKYLGIQSGGKREISFLVDDETVNFDPNRIFTIPGIEKTLKNYKCYTASNLKQVEAFSSGLIELLSKAKLLVALHNNSNGGFSIKSLLKEKTTKKDALEIYVNPQKDQDDFYYVTQKAQFDYFKNKGYSVVLQDNINVEDDGSLSVYCGRKKISYINVECESNHLNEQIKMIKEIFTGYLNGSF